TMTTTRTTNARDRLLLPVPGPRGCTGAAPAREVRTTDAAETFASGTIAARALPPHQPPAVLEEDVAPVRGGARFASLGTALEPCARILILELVASGRRLQYANVRAWTLVRILELVAPRWRLHCAEVRAAAWAAAFEFQAAR